MKRMVLWAVGLLAACSSDDRAPISGQDPFASPPPVTCSRDADCSSGLICVATRCVSPGDLLPPDVEQSATSQPPVASTRYLFALAPDSDTVAVIDAQTLAIEAVHVAADPVALDELPGRDAVIALSRSGRSLTSIVMDGGEPRIGTVKLRRSFSRLTVSPDGRYAVAWTHALDPPDAGAEGLVTVVPLVDGSTVGFGLPVELAAGYRHTNVLFRVRGGVSEAVIALGKDEAAIIALPVPDAPDYVPPRLRLPDGYTDVVGREVVAAPDGRFVLMRSFAAPELAALEIDTATVTTIPLPALATDLDIVSTGTLAVAALRESAQLALIPLPAAFTASTAVRIVDVEGGSVGQVELTPDARFAAVFSAADGSEQLAWVDLASGEARLFDRLRKRIQSVGIAPGGGHAVIIHQSDPESTVADPYEREVDRDEGYSVLDLDRGIAQLKRTDRVRPGQLVFTARGTHALITLRDDSRRIFRAEVADLRTLVIDAYALASAPLFAGALPIGDRLWITQQHPAGRISFLDAETREVRTATGYHLNAGIE